MSTFWTRLAEIKMKWEVRGKKVWPAIFTFLQESLVLLIVQLALAGHIFKAVNIFWGTTTWLTRREKERSWRLPCRKFVAWKRGGRRRNRCIYKKKKNHTHKKHQRCVKIDCGKAVEKGGVLILPGGKTWKGPWRMGRMYRQLSFPSPAPF